MLHTEAEVGMREAGRGGNSKREISVLVLNFILVPTRINHLLGHLERDVRFTEKDQHLAMFSQ